MCVFRLGHMVQFVLFMLAPDWFCFVSPDIIILWSVPVWPCSTVCPYHLPTQQSPLPPWLDESQHQLFPWVVLFEQQNYVVYNNFKNIIILNLLLIKRTMTTTITTLLLHHHHHHSWRIMIDNGSNWIENTKNGCPNYEHLNDVGTFPLQVPQFKKYAILSTKRQKTLALLRSTRTHHKYVDRL